MTVMRRYILPVLVAVICWSGAKAQNEVLPSRSLTIEGAYNPEMSEALGWYNYGGMSPLLISSDEESQDEEDGQTSSEEAGSEY